MNSKQRLSHLYKIWPCLTEWQHINLVVTGRRFLQPSPKLSHRKSSFFWTFYGWLLKTSLALSLILLFLFPPNNAPLAFLGGYIMAFGLFSLGLLVKRIGLILN